ncbi:MAG: MobH family relaxase, partial [Saezia sp.]
AYAALLHDIGKIAVDLHVELDDNRVWHPWHGPLKKPYRFLYRKEREYRLHNASTGLLYHQILDARILDWLCQTPKLWASFLYVLAGQFEHAGILGEIITKADQASVAQELGGDPVKVMAAPKHALQRKLLDGLRYLVKEELKLNNSGPSDAWLTDDALWLVSKTVSDKLRAHLLSSGVSGIPEKNSAIFDVLQEHSIIQATEEDKAIWSATVSSTSGWTNKFTFLKVSPALIWESDERPMPFSGTVVVEAVGDLTVAIDHDIGVRKGEEGVASSAHAGKASIVAEVKADSLDTVFDILGIEKADSVTVVDEEVVVDHSVLEHNPQPLDVENIPGVYPSSERKATGEGGLSGEHFYNWLKEGILRRKLMINEPRALIHTVDNTLYLVTPGIFKRYALEFPEVQKLAEQEKILEWRWVQKHFEKLGVHRKQLGGLNIWKCIVQGPRKTREVSGYLLTEPENIIQSIPFNNPYLKVKIED